MRHRLLAVRGGESRWDGALHVMLQRWCFNPHLRGSSPCRSRACDSTSLPEIGVGEDHMCALASDRQMHAQEREAREDSYLKSSL